MIFNTHSNLVGQHAFLSASKYHWINYDEDKLDRYFLAMQQVKRGVEEHNLAHELIRMRIHLRGKSTLALHVNDAIGFRMSPEQVLYYSDNCFGTTDAISFSRGKLRIHDLKTGKRDTSVHQLEVYAALFCLEYMVKPFEIATELRIYQHNDIQKWDADPDVITHIMDKIKTFDKRIAAIRMEGPS